MSAQRTSVLLAGRKWVDGRRMINGRSKKRDRNEAETLFSALVRVGGART
jgi:hypothetical protein